MTPITNRDEFEYWLASMGYSIEEDLLMVVELETRNKLDLSAESLDILEGIILQRYPNTNSMLNASESKFVNALACYVGETFRKGQGGKWTIEFDNPKSAYYSLPILVRNESSGRVVQCPHTLVTATADRRTGTYLRKVFEETGSNLNSTRQP